MDKAKNPEVSRSQAALKRHIELDDLLSNTFNVILRVEEKALDNKITEGLTITEVHTIVAVGLHGSNPMSVIASRLDVALATLTTAVSKLVAKGFIKRERSAEDRRIVLIGLTKEGRKVYRAHEVFHRNMITEALAELSEEEEQVLSKALAKVKIYFETKAE